MFFQFITTLLFPRKCWVCQKRIERGILCAPCVSSASLRTAAPALHHTKLFTLGAAGYYEDPVVKTLIHALKFNSIKEAAQPLASLLITYTQKMNITFPEAIVIPIPLSKRRERSRGFNQTELIAHYFAQAFTLPLITTSLIRIKHAPPQSTMKSSWERRRNIKNGFAIADSTSLARKQVILIDDVSTSGATFYEAALTCKTAGAEHILALAVATPKSLSAKDMVY